MKALLDDHKFAFIACVNDERLWKTCESYLDRLQVPPGFTIERVKVTGAKGMAEGYNEGMRRTDARYKVYLHQDTFMRDPEVLFKLLELFRNPAIGLVGVVGATRLPASGVWFHAGLHSHGKVWENRTGGGLWHLLGSLNTRRDHLMTFRPVPRPWLPVVVVDGLLMVTQYDIPWREDLDFGFIYYEGPQCLEFIKQGHLVVIPHQDEVWCMHYGNLGERDPVAWEKYQERFRANMAIFCQQYAEFIQRPIKEILAKYGPR